MHVRIHDLRIGNIGLRVVGGDCMSEYIVEMPKEPAKVVRDGWNVRIEWQYKQREKIVRCRDCRLQDDIKYCERLGFKVGDNGYCAWPVRREG